MSLSRNTRPATGRHMRHAALSTVRPNRHFYLRMCTSLSSGPPRLREEGRLVSPTLIQLVQFSLRFGIGVSNCAISAFCAALPLNVSTLPLAEIAT